MKNLLAQFTKGKDLKQIKTRDFNDWYEVKTPYHPTEGVSVWKRIDRIVAANVGKSFDTAFSKFCSEVPKYQQHIFIEHFRRYRWHTSELWTHYYLDQNNVIRKHIGTYQKRNKKAYYFSDNYATDYRHKVTGAPKPTYYWMNKQFKESDYENVVVQGYFIEFSSKKDPEYIRLTTDQRKRRNAALREYQKAKEAKAYSFISKSEEEREKEKAENRVKIEAKGFDYYTSFRDAGINPDEIAKLQGFVK